MSTRRSRKVTFASRRKSRRSKTGGEKAKVARLTKKVNAVLPSKNKFFIASAAGLSPDNTGAVGYTLLCNPAQGDTILNRTGDRLRANKLRWGVTMDHTTGVGINNNLSAVRMMIIYDHENSFSNMLQLLNSSTNILFSDYAQSERPRWTLIKDKVLHWPASTPIYSTGGYSPSMLFKGSKSLNQKLVTFTSGGTTVYHGQIKVFFAANSGAGGTMSSLSFYSECYFSDVL